MRLAQCLLAALVGLMADAGATCANAELGHFPPARLDHPTVFDELRQQADGGDAAAAYRLGLMYRNAGSLAQDKARAAYWVGVAAKRGMAAAMFTLSNMLDEGEGLTVDKVAARRWLEVAAGLEYPEALQQLALTETDPARAALLMKQAAHAMLHRAPSTPR
jgi:TPR repeat protein